MAVGAVERLKLVDVVEGVVVAVGTQQPVDVDARAVDVDVDAQQEAVGALHERAGKLGRGPPIGAVFRYHGYHV